MFASAVHHGRREYQQQKVQVDRRRIKQAFRVGKQVFEYKSFVVQKISYPKAEYTLCETILRRLAQLASGIWIETSIVLEDTRHSSDELAVAIPNIYIGWIPRASSGKARARR